MSEKRGEIKMNKNAKKANETKKNTNMLELIDGPNLKTNCVYKRGKKLFKMQNIDFHKIKVSKKKLYSKTHKAYKHFVLHVYNNEYVPLLIKLPNMIGRYKAFNDNNNNNKKKDFTCKNERLLKKI